MFAQLISVLFGQIFHVGIPNFPPESFRIDFSSVDFSFSQIVFLLYFGAQQATADTRCCGGPRYLSQDEVLDQSNPFVQLVSGVVWLLRNGEVYINQSLTAECKATQETGTKCEVM